ncbi:DUF3293 domain-containing protein [Limnohabitans sp.]
MDSESLISPETIQAYRKTEFRVDSDTPLTLRIAEPNDGLFGLFKANRSDTCAFVTACNPLGQLLGESENAQLQDHLAHELRFRRLGGSVAHRSEGSRTSPSCGKSGRDLADLMGVKSKTARPVIALAAAQTAVSGLMQGQGI